MQTIKSPKAGERTQDIECIGEEKFSDSNDSLRPVYRAYGAAGKWSGKHIPPAIGATIKINFNGLGEGEVVGYEVASRWLAMRVRLTKAPAWLIKQGGGKAPSLIFGAEFSPV